MRKAPCKKRKKTWSNKKKIKRFQRIISYVIVCNLAKLLVVPIARVSWCSSNNQLRAEKSSSLAKLFVVNQTGLAADLKWKKSVSHFRLKSTELSYLVRHGLEKDAGSTNLFRVSLVSVSQVTTARQVKSLKWNYHLKANKKTFSIPITMIRSCGLSIPTYAAQLAVDPE